MKRYLAVAGVAWVAMLCNMARSGIVAPASVAFTDVTGQAGIKFVHNSGRAGKKYLPETLGSGAAWFDADGDGWPDLLLINSKDWTPRGRKSLPALYRNNHNGTFTECHRRAAAWTWRCTGWAWPSAITITTAATMCTSRPSKATTYSTTKVTANSGT